MNRILLINDYRKEQRVGKILYVYADDSSEITAYFYVNSWRFDHHKIRRNYDKDKKTLGPLEHVGEIQVNEGLLAFVAVEPDYQCCGIGLKLLQLAKKHLDLTRIVCVKECQRYDYCLTQAGERLVVAAVKKGLVGPEMCDFKVDSLFDEPSYVSDTIMRELSGRNKEDFPPNKAAKLSRSQTLPQALADRKKKLPSGYITLDRFLIPLADHSNATHGSPLKRNCTM